MNEFELIERYFRRAPRNADVRIEAEHECTNPVGIGGWQRTGKQYETRQCAHRREVRQVDGERLVAKVARIGVLSLIHI